MPGNARVSDFLNLHANVSRRVRNLETGVHPVTANIDYYDSTDWAEVDLEPGVTHYFEGSTDFTWMWRKRFGICTMRGGINGASGHVGNIPTSQAPATQMQVLVMLPDDSPFYAQATIGSDGQISVTGASSADYITFDQITWTAG